VDKGDGFHVIASSHRPAATDPPWMKLKTISAHRGTVVIPAQSGTQSLLIMRPERE
jgi:hypothetical protein